MLVLFRTDKSLQHTRHNFPRHLLQQRSGISWATLTTVETQGHAASSLIRSWWAAHTACLCSSTWKEPVLSLLAQRAVLQRWHPCTCLEGARPTTRAVCDRLCSRPTLILACCTQQTVGAVRHPHSCPIRSLWARNTAFQCLSTLQALIHSCIAKQTVMD